jgi:hypothetical protein
MRSFCVTLPVFVDLFQIASWSLEQEPGAADGPRILDDGLASTDFQCPFNIQVDFVAVHPVILPQVESQRKSLGFNRI